MQNKRIRDWSVAVLCARKHQRTSARLIQRFHLVTSQSTDTREQTSLWSDACHALCVCSFPQDLNKYNLNQL